MLNSAFARIENHYFINEVSVIHTHLLLLTLVFGARVSLDKDSYWKSNRSIGCESPSAFTQDFTWNFPITRSRHIPCVVVQGNATFLYRWMFPPLIPQTTLV